MRTLLVLIGLVILAVVAAMYFGLINIDQTRSASFQPPRFQANVARVSVGTENKTVAVPTVNVDKPADTQ